LSGQEYTQPGMFIANGRRRTSGRDADPAGLGPGPGANAPPAPAHNGQAYWLKLSAKSDGTFTVTNQRNGFFKTYAPALMAE